MAASQNEIPNTNEALDELISELHKNGVKPGDFKKIRIYANKTSDPDDKLENYYRFDFIGLDYPGSRFNKTLSPLGINF